MIIRQTPAPETGGMQTVPGIEESRTTHPASAKSVSAGSKPDAKQVHACILSGSGADSAYQVGVLKALCGGKSPATRNEPIEPSVLAGTSTGAFNAALLASQWKTRGPGAVEQLEEIWQSRLAWNGFIDGGCRIRLNPFAVVNPAAYIQAPLLTAARFFGDFRGLSNTFAIRLREALFKGPFLDRLTDLIDFSLLVATETLRDTMAASIDFDKLGDSASRLTVATLNWEKGQICHSTNADNPESICLDLLLAAGAVPGYFTPGTVRDQIFVDAESQLTAPLKPALDQLHQCTRSHSEEPEYHLHVIYLCAKRNEMPPSALANMLQTYYGSHIISWTSRIDNDLKRAHRINRGIVMVEDLAALQRFEAPGSQEPETETIRTIRERVASMPPRERQGLLALCSEVVNRIQTAREWKKVTIHRHFPSQGLDSSIGFMDFRRDRISALMKQGFADTVAHDCTENRCIRVEPGRAAAGVPREPRPSAGSIVAPRNALIFSGGGAYGAYQVGCMKALFGDAPAPTAPERLSPDVFAGTSIGAFNASFLVSGWHLGGPAAVGNLESTWLEKMSWRNGTNGGFRLRFAPLELLFPSRYSEKGIWSRVLGNFNRDVVQLLEETAARGWGFLSQNQPLLERLASCVDLSALVAPEPWEHTIRSVIDFERIRSSSRRLTIAATNWQRGLVAHFNNQNVSPEAVRASSAIPGFYAPAVVGGQTCVDGAVLMNTPLKPAISELLALDPGAESELVLHVMYINPHVEKSSNPRGTINTVFRSQAIQWGTSVEEDIESARVLNDGLSVVIERLIAYGKESGTQLLNSELEIVRDAVLSRSEEGGRALLETADRIMRARERGRHYQQLTIHRYFPKEPISGAFGFMDVRRSTIEKLIDEGFQDTMAHDCVANGCVLAHRQPEVAPQVDGDSSGRDLLQSRRQVGLSVGAS
jgi:predicted acylesterase/phospholipase RssA